MNIPNIFFKDPKEIEPKDRPAKVVMSDTPIKDAIAPQEIHVDFNTLKIGNLYYRYLFLCALKYLENIPRDGFFLFAVLFYA